MHTTVLHLYIPKPTKKKEVADDGSVHQRRPAVCLSNGKNGNETRHQMK